MSYLIIVVSVLLIGLMHGGPHYSGPSYFENQDYPIAFYLITWFLVFVLWIIGLNLLLINGKGKLKIDKTFILYKKSRFSESKDITQSIVQISRSYDNWRHNDEGLIWSLRLENNREIQFWSLVMLIIYWRLFW